MDYCSLAYRCPELVSRLCSICGRSELNIALVVEEETDQLANNKVPTNTEWPARWHTIQPTFELLLQLFQDFCLRMIVRFCSSAGSGEDRQVCTNILAALEKEDLDFIFLETELPLVCKQVHLLTWFEGLYWKCHYSICKIHVLCGCFISVLVGELYCAWSLAESQLEEFRLWCFRGTTDRNKLHYTSFIWSMLRVSELHACTV